MNKNWLAVIGAANVAVGAWMILTTPPPPDVNAILIAPCEGVPVVIFTRADGSFTSITPGAPPSEELISRIKRTKRSQINLSCTKETLR